MTTLVNPFLKLTAPGLPGLQPYIPGKPLSELERELGISNSIKLASNENPLGPGNLAREAAMAALAELGRYPDGGGFDLRRALAEHHGLEAAAVTLGNGSNDVLDLVARVFLHPGQESVFSEHAFAVYAIGTQAVGATARVAKARDYGHDLEAMAALVNERTRVVWIANPNNPTGTWLDADSLASFLGELPETCVVVVDEAYTEYVEDPDFPDATRWLDRSRTLSSPAPSPRSMVWRPCGWAMASATPISPTCSTAPVSPSTSTASPRRRPWRRWPTRCMFGPLWH
jgi:histidinol-phosphate aminotransferase